MVSIVSKPVGVPTKGGQVETQQVPSLIIYSVRKLFTGLANEAFID